MKTNKKRIMYSLFFFILGVATFFFFSHKNISKTPHAVNEPVITPTTYKKISVDPNVDTSSWMTFTDKQLKYSIKYPDTISLDARQTVEGRINVFVFTEDQKKDSQRQVPALYIVNTHKNGSDGFSAFMKGDCKQPCKTSYKTAEWVNINNVYGIKNPLPEDVSNYYVTDKDQQSIVINAYSGNYKNTANPDAKKKMDTFEQMIRTIQFSPTQNHS